MPSPVWPGTNPQTPWFVWLPDARKPNTRIWQKQKQCFSCCPKMKRLEKYFSHQLYLNMINLNYIVQRSKILPHHFTKPVSQAARDTSSHPAWAPCHDLSESRWITLSSNILWGSVLGGILLELEEKALRWVVLKYRFWSLLALFKQPHNSDCPSKTLYNYYYLISLYWQNFGHF